jgi:hypothetical protein
MNSIPQKLPPLVTVNNPLSLKNSNSKSFLAGHTVTGLSPKNLRNTPVEEKNFVVEATAPKILLGLPTKKPLGSIEPNPPVQNS